jgi:oligopeptide/dipeptide ABC transporter ATP-binding protein
MAEQTIHPMKVRNLKTSFRTDEGTITAVDGISFDVESGKTLCIVGESGCGKSVTALSLIRLIPSSNGSISSDSRIEIDGVNLLTLTEDQMREYRGDHVAMIFQEPMTALNPVYTIGQQISEVFEIHRKMSKRDALKASIQMLEQVKMPDPHRRINEYPHQLSGGMKQRVLIAMALACKPKVLIADEPSTALDVTVQAQMLKLMKDLQHELGTAIIFITHDLGVVAEIADDVVVMYAGRIVESGDVYEIFDSAQHPYTQALLKSIPRIDSTPKEPLETISGMVPSLSDLPSGCRFRDRCPKADKICEDKIPNLENTTSQSHQVACHFWKND